MGKHEARRFKILWCIQLLLYKQAIGRQGRRHCTEGPHFVYVEIPEAVVDYVLVLLVYSVRAPPLDGDAGGATLMAAPARSGWG